VTDWKAVGLRIAAQRKALGWTQQMLGERVGDSGNYVTRVESGLPISEKKLANYAAALGLSLPYLRYNVATADDADVVRRAGIAEGRAHALQSMRGWVGREETRSPDSLESGDDITAGAIPLTPAQTARAEEADAEEVAQKATKSAPRARPRKLKGK
jgi:transcriptional regulator with XRE-family HTH domain